MSVEPADIERHLRQLFGEESRLLTQLEGLLESERATLAGDDVDAISRIGTTRHDCVNALSHLDAERVDTCRMLSFGRGREAVNRLCDWADPSGRLGEAWVANLEIAQRCRAANSRNGALVTARLRAVQNLLSQLRGALEPPVYSAAGARRSQLGARDLGRA